MYEITKPFYIIMKTALLWYRTFLNCLKADGFKINKYDPCIENKMINGKQRTVCWYVDDTKISHVDKDVVSEARKNIESQFDEMKVSRGNDHTFVGMKSKLKRMVH